MKLGVNEALCYGNDTSAFADDLLRLLVAETRGYSVVLLDEHGNILSCSAGAARPAGYTAKEIIGRPFSVFYTPQDRATGKPEHDLTIARTDGRLEDERWRVRQDGGQFWAQVVLTPLWDDAGALRGYGEVTRDLSELRAHELELAGGEDRFRRSFDEASIGMMIFDLQGRYMHVNDAFCAIVGHPREALEGFSRDLITHPDDLAADADALRALLAGEMTTHTREKRYIRADGRPVWATIGVTLLTGADGRSEHFIGHAQDITERRGYEDHLVAMADQDPLTGLLNRRGFKRELDNEVARVKRFEITSAVLVIDLDNFKRVNDTHGHSAGDELIVRTAHGFRNRLRETDAIGRLGGDEFAVLLPQQDHQGAGLVARALLDLVFTQAPAAVGSREPITASIGIACFSDGEALTADEIMSNADLAMYEVKNAGRNGIAAFRPELNTPRPSRKPSP